MDTKRTHGLDSAYHTQSQIEQPVRKKSRFGDAPTDAAGAGSSQHGFAIPPPPRPPPPPPAQPPPPPPASSSYPSSTSSASASSSALNGSTAFSMNKPLSFTSRGSTTSSSSSSVKPTLGFNFLQAKKPTTAPISKGFSLAPVETSNTDFTKAKPKLPFLPPSIVQPSKPAPPPAVASAEVDPLDSFMQDLNTNMTDVERKAVNGETEAEERKQMAAESSRAKVTIEDESKENKQDTMMSDATSSFSAATAAASSTAAPAIERYFGDEDQVDETVIAEHNTAAENGLSWLEKQSKIKKKEIKPVDHATMNYAPFRKDFYIESKEIASMSDEVVAAYRETVMEGVKIRGKNCPKPIRTWLHCGLPDRVLAIIQKEGFKAPFAIQQQAIPAIMSGRDVIACAKTGSGKTLAFVLPMIRHVMDQPPVAPGEGPIALILVPLRELATQIYNVCKKFCKPLNLRCVCVYGGASVAEQIIQLKRSTEIIVGTPGRMIDVLTLNKGSITNLHRVTYVVLDEADRMFDMGFEPQVCLAGDTHVTLTHLLSRPIDSLATLSKSSHSVYGFNGEGMELSQPTNWCDSGRQECVRVTLADGRSIVCTPTHRIMTPNGWIEAQNLKSHSSRILCSLDSIQDTIEQEECGWQHRFNEHRTLRLDTTLDRDTSFAFVRTLALFSCHSLRLPSPIDTASIQADLHLLLPSASFDDASSSLSLPAELQADFNPLLPHHLTGQQHLPSPPSFLSSPATPRCIVREYLRTIFGQYADAPTLADRDSFFHIRWSVADMTGSTLQTLSTYQQLLTRFNITSTITSTPSSITLAVLNTIQFATSLGFVHASEKSFRLAAATAFLRTQQQKSTETMSARNFLTDAGCITHFDSSSKSQLISSPHVPVFHLPVISVSPAGMHSTYDITVSQTHSFLASNMCVHNCKIVENIRPEKQMVLFSATFPKSIESLARKSLKNPLEIVIGGKSVASSSITQFVEVREASQKFPRLLEILGQWYRLDNCILIFVDKQEAVDALFRQLNDAGYPCAALHGGMDQSDREFTIADFKSKIRTVLVATAVASRGLDVPSLTLVVNYDVPNHYEAYVHQVGRTGRAGKAGTAITFIEPDELKHAPDLVKALTGAKQVVPRDLKAMADKFNAMVKSGEIKWHGHSGYLTSGFSFSAQETAEKKNQQKLLKMASDPDADAEELAAIEENTKSLEESKRAKDKSTTPATAATTGTTASTASFAAPPKPATAASGGAPGALDPIARQLAVLKATLLAAKTAQSQQNKLLIAGSGDDTTAEAKIQEAVAAARAAEERRQLTLAAEEAQRLVREKLHLIINKTTVRPPNGAIVATGEDDKRTFTARIDINDYPKTARWKATHTGTGGRIDQIIDETECAVTTKGTYFPPGRTPGFNEEKLWLLIQGATEMSVQRCRAEIMRLLEDAAAEAPPPTTKKYSVV